MICLFTLASATSKQTKLMALQLFPSEGLQTASHKVKSHYGQLGGINATDSSLPGNRAPSVSVPLPVLLSSLKQVGLICPTVGLCVLAGKVGHEISCGITVYLQPGSMDRGMLCPSCFLLSTQFRTWAHRMAPTIWMSLHSSLLRTPHRSPETCLPGGSWSCQADSVDYHTT